MLRAKQQKGIVPSIYLNIIILTLCVTVVGSVVLLYYCVRTMYLLNHLLSYECVTLLATVVTRRQLATNQSSSTAVRVYNLDLNSLTHSLSCAPCCSNLTILLLQFDCAVTPIFFWLRSLTHIPYTSTWQTMEWL